jgi:hypothetical protein
LALDPAAVATANTQQRFRLVAVCGYRLAGIPRRMVAVKTRARCGAILVVMAAFHRGSTDVPQVRISTQLQTADAGWSSRLTMGRHRKDCR